MQLRSVGIFVSGVFVPAAITFIGLIELKGVFTAIFTRQTNVKSLTVCWSSGDGAFDLNEEVPAYIILTTALKLMNQSISFPLAMIPS